MPHSNARLAYHGTKPAKAAEVLSQCYSDRAGEEALFRAMLAERDLRHNEVQFWLEVYLRVSACWDDA